MTIIEKPMLFSGPMVQAILDGRKTQTRRGVKPQPESDIQSAYPDASSKGWIFWSMPQSDKTAEFTKQQYPDNGIRPPHPVGSHIWVRETWCLWRQGWDRTGHVIYKADMRDATGYEFKDDELTENWHPSISMLRKFSRITLEVTDVRVQRLQEITEDDARAEGFNGGSFEFVYLWDKLNLKRGHGWDTNPWVWAYTFKAVQP